MSPTPNPTRRRLMLAAATLAGVAGVGTGLWWSGRRTPQQAVGEALPPDFWQQQFDTLSAKPLRLSSMQGKPLLVNFWATWCPPCVKEMPDLERFFQEHRSQDWQVLGLAIDGPTPVKEFLQRRPVSFAIGLAGFGGTELAQALGNTAGGLPFTVLIDRAGRIRQRKMGATNHEELRLWARGIA